MPLSDVIIEQCYNALMTGSVAIQGNSTTSGEFVVTDPEQVGLAVLFPAEGQLPNALYVKAAKVPPEGRWVLEVATETATLLLIFPMPDNKLAICYPALSNLYSEDKSHAK